MRNENSPALTPEQLIALLDQMCLAGCCAVRQHQGQQVYMLSVSSIHVAADILQGKSGAKQT